MVHVPLYVSEKFKGKSKAGLFGDVMMEVDWSVGRILETLRKNKLDKDTLVIFTSDNGPWLNYGDHAGSAAPLREGKGTMFDGGCRESTLTWMPGTIPPDSVCNEPAMTIDILPTIAHLIGAKLPKQPHRRKKTFGPSSPVTNPSPHTRHITFTTAINCKPFEQVSGSYTFPTDTAPWRVVREAKEGFPPTIHKQRLD